MEAFLKWAQQQGCTVESNVPMASVTTFKIGGPADMLITAPDRQVAGTLLATARREQLPLLFIGSGSNLLISDEGFRGIVLRLSAADAPRLSDAHTIVCGAGVPLARLSRFAQQAGLSGLAFACGIPGTVGGGVYMNAGAYGGEMKDVVRSATVLFPDGTEQVLTADQLALGYRHSALMDNGGLVMQVTMTLPAGDAAAIDAEMSDLLRRRREKQPLEYPSAGSFFKRPEGHFAGRLIEDCGLKGYRVGDAQVSEKHAGFVVNRGQATCEQVCRLAREVSAQVYSRTGVRLQPEVRLCGEHADWGF